MDEKKRLDQKWRYEIKVTIKVTIVDLSQVDLTRNLFMDIINAN